MVNLAVRIAKGFVQADGRCSISYVDKIKNGKSLKLSGRDEEQVAKNLAAELIAHGFTAKAVKTPAYEQGSYRAGLGVSYWTNPGNWRVRVWEA